jgi:hypothetical protein
MRDDAREKRAREELDRTDFAETVRFLSFE